jgi:hypothetical protein
MGLNIESGGGAGSRPRHKKQAEAHTSYKPDEQNRKSVVVIEVDNENWKH